MTTIGQIVFSQGGWIVSSNQTAQHEGSISIRVSSERLGEVVGFLKAMATKVESEASSSQDFTDEYVDTQARVANFQATEEALRTMIDKSESIEDALRVQGELTTIQEEIEVLQGRINFLGQTFAFSLINVQLKLSAQTVAVDTGGD